MTMNIMTSETQNVYIIDKWQRSMKNSWKWKVYWKNVNTVWRIFTYIFDRWFVTHWNGFLFFGCFYVHCNRCHFLFFLQINWVSRKFWNKSCKETYVIVGFNRFGNFFIRSHDYLQVLSLFYQFFRDFRIVVKITISLFCTVKCWKPNVDQKRLFRQIFRLFW